MKGVWHYLYRAVDLKGNTLGWMLNKERNKEAAMKFFRQMLANEHCTAPRAMGINKNAAYTLSFEKLQEEGVILAKTEL